MVALQPFGIIVRQCGYAAQVHVVFEIGQLDATREAIVRQSRDIIGIGFVSAFGEQSNRVDNIIGETFFAKVVKSSIAVFDDIVQNCDDFFIRRFDAGHHANRMKDVWLTVLIDLAGMGIDSNCNRFIECGHR